MRPIGVAGFGHGDEVSSEKDGRHAIDIQQLRRQRRWMRRRNGRTRGQILKEWSGEILGKDTMVREKLESLENPC